MGGLWGIPDAISSRIRSRLAMRRARAETLRNLSARAVERVLVVCHGNIYRSPFVAELLRRSPLALKQVGSVGFHPRGDRQSPARHQAMCADFGVSLQNHRSAVVSATDLQWADIIILMDRYNWVRLVRLGADSSKLVWIGALTDGPVEIPDPYHLGDEEARRVLGRLKAGTETLIRMLDKGGSK